MATEIRVIKKRFNHDLLVEELSALPYANLHLAGFSKVNLYVSKPSTAPTLISSSRKADKSYDTDYADPGEIRVEMSRDLTLQEGSDLDDLLAAHDDTKYTAAQRRQRQDNTDYATLVTRYPNIDGMSNLQLRNYIKLMARLLIRDKLADTAI